MLRSLVFVSLCFILCGCGAKVSFDLKYDNLAKELSDYGVGETAFDANDPLLEKRTIFICGGFNISLAQTVCRQLVYLDSESKTEPIKLLINSPGGDGTAYLSITNMINSISAPVDTINIGFCGSAAAMLIQSATGKRYAVKDTAFMIHDTKGSPKDLSDMYSKLQEGIYRSCCELPDDWLPLKDGEYVFSAEDAKTYKFVD